MNRNNLRWNIILALLLAVLCSSIYGQSQWISSVSIQNDSFQIGDPVTLKVKIIVPNDLNIESLNFTNYREIPNILYDKDTVFLEKYADLEILDFGNWKSNDINIPITKDKLDIQDKNGQQEITNIIKVAIYNMGAFAIPGPVVTTFPTTSGLPTENKVVKIYLPKKLMQRDTVVFNPIKDIMVEDANFYDYLGYIYILVTILLLVGIGYYFYKRKKEEVKEPEIVKDIKIPAHVKALNALNFLDSQQLWQKGKIKDYQSGLTDAIRTYLEDRYHVNAMEMTTDEIANSLKGVDFDLTNIDILREILQVADLVKFAKAQPLDDIHSQFMVKAKAFIENTKLTQPEPESEL